VQNPDEDAPVPTDVTRLDTLPRQMLEAYQEGDFKHSSLLAFSVVKETPTDQVGWIIHLESLFQGGQVLRALSSVDTALRMIPGSADLHRLRGEILVALGRDPEAEESLRESLSRDPENPLAVQALAAILTKGGREAEAAHLPHVDEVQDRQAAVLARLHRAGSVPSVDALRRIVAAAPAFAEAYAALADVMSATEDTLDLANVYARTVQLRPKAVRPRYGYARVLTDQGDLFEARDVIRAAVALRPEAPQGYFGMAYVLYFMMRSEGAAINHRRGTMLAPDHPGARLPIARVVDQVPHAELNWFFAD